MIAGYELAYRWIVRHKDLICDLVDNVVDDDFRIRLLFRPTRLYAATCHLLNLPCLYGHDLWTASLFRRFRESAAFKPHPSSKAIAAEWNDLELRDIPYFWIEAGEKVIRHKSGIVQRLGHPDTPKQRAIADIRHLTCDDLGEQLTVLNGFLDLDISCTSGGAAA